MATCRDPIGLTLQALAALIFSMLLAACSTGNERDRDATAKDERGTSKAGGEGEARSRAIVPRGATIAASGFASILSAPPRPYDNEPPPPVDQTNPEVAAIAQKLGISPREAEAQMNPDRATSLAATELVGRLQADAKGNFITIAIERDPLPYYVFYFRHDAAATLAGFTKNASFHARQQGVSKNELQPIYDEWWQRFEPQKLIGGGAIDEIHGVVHFDMNINEAGFNKIAKREEWRLPEQLELRFSRVRNPRSVDPALASFVRIFPREDRSPAILNMAAIQGRIVLRDGCFRVSESFLPANALVILDATLSSRSIVKVTWWWANLARIILPHVLAKRCGGVDHAALTKPTPACSSSGVDAARDR